MNILVKMLCASLVLVSAAVFAEDNTTSSQAATKTTKTSMKSNWVCTTNASSSDKKADKDADKRMSEHAGFASKSFEFAAKHCRDCTQITCNVKK